jgi:hypothetical protein
MGGNEYAEKSNVLRADMHAENCTHAREAKVKKRTAKGHRAAPPNSEHRTHVREGDASENSDSNNGGKEKWRKGNAGNESGGNLSARLSKR